MQLLRKLLIYAINIYLMISAIVLKKLLISDKKNKITLDLYISTEHTLGDSVIQKKVLDNINYGSIALLKYSNFNVLNYGLRECMQIKTLGKNSPNILLIPFIAYITARILLKKYRFGRVIISRRYKDYLGIFLGYILDSKNLIGFSGGITLDRSEHHPMLIKFIKSPVVVESPDNLNEEEVHKHLFTRKDFITKKEVNVTNYIIEKKLITISVSGGNSKLKRASNNFYEKLINKMIESIIDVDILIIIPFSDIDDLNYYSNIINNKINIIYNETLENLASILKKSWIYIGNDTGLSHFASLHAKKLILLFGSSSIEKFSPTSTGIKIITNRTECGPNHIKNSLDRCKSCNLSKPICIEGINIDEIILEIKNYEKNINIR